MSAERRDIVLLAASSPRTNIVYNYLSAVYGPFPVILEKRQPRKQLLKRRMRRLGWHRALSQATFSALVSPAVARLSRPRIRAIVNAESLDTTPIPESQVHHVPSVNDAATMALLQNFRPAVVVVNGTRIIERSILEALSAYFFNIHMGITPRYRGAHGAYWARWEDNEVDCGVTVHRVDPGVDTGSIFAQARVAPEKGDTIITYPYLQMAAALPGVKAAVSAGLAGSCSTYEAVGASALWHNPTVGEYLRGLLRGIK